VQKLGWNVNIVIWYSLILVIYWQLGYYLHFTVLFDQIKHMYACNFRHKLFYENFALAVGSNPRLKLDWPTCKQYRHSLWYQCVRKEIVQLGMWLW